MSILTSLYHDEEQLLPNSVHNEPPDDTRVYVRASPLTADAYRWLYENVHPDVLLASISGGTDIMACFAAGNPALPARCQ